MSCERAMLMCTCKLAPSHTIPCRISLGHLQLHRTPPRQNLDKARDQKLSSQLNKIEGIMKEKGTYNEAAFRARPDGGDALDAPTPMRAKRMRI
jgi:hypothetical protein